MSRPVKKGTRNLSANYLVAALVLLVLSGAGIVLAQGAQGETRYVRYEHRGTVSHGVLEGDSVRALDGDLFGTHRPTGKPIPLTDVKLLAPVEPSKALAVGLNYGSHLGRAEAPKEPALFAKMPTSIVGPGDAIELPADAENVHYEAELVIVIGKKAKNVSVAEAPDHIFGVTAGNDVSGRNWQGADLQWFRAKASDTFGPIGPVIARGIDYDDLLLEGRLNGKVVQKQRTSDLIFSTADIVSFASRYVTLFPGDVIFTGTPGRTQALSDGDTIEIELEGVGVLSNPVKQLRE